MVLPSELIVAVPAVAFNELSHPVLPVSKSWPSEPSWNVSIPDSTELTAAHVDPVYRFNVAIFLSTRVYPKVV
jgi:hypothetical protein